MLLIQTPLSDQFLDDLSNRSSRSFELVLASFTGHGVQANTSSEDFTHQNRVARRSLPKGFADLESVFGPRLVVGRIRICRTSAHVRGQILKVGFPFRIFEQSAIGFFFFGPQIIKRLQYVSGRLRNDGPSHVLHVRNVYSTILLNLMQFLPAKEGRGCMIEQAPRRHFRVAKLHSFRVSTKKLLPSVVRWSRIAKREAPSSGDHKRFVGLSVKSVHHSKGHFANTNPRRQVVESATNKGTILTDGGWCPTADTKFHSQPDHLNC
mmetsp:Transcript_14254/g.28752  ORF Transcript_14254/g.28752 Transcript_14254/m.28752 type:complete len:265 (+) Transcript_14254:227-1021(+)